MTETGGAVQAKRSLRAKVASAAGRLAGDVSRATGRGAGGMFGGHIALKIDPNVLSELSKGRKIVLVSGTNGKSTTTRLTVEALRNLGPVAANLGGDNMPTGIVTALINQPDARFAVLEVDEMHLPMVVEATSPEAIILLNLSRDQLDRVGEIGKVESRIRQGVDKAGNALIVANCDDPLITSAAWDAKNLTWVAAGSSWHSDSTTFPRTGTLVVRDSNGWAVSGSDRYMRPDADWVIKENPGSENFNLVGPNGIDMAVQLRLPGRVNQGNAAQAAAVATYFGVSPQDIVRSLGSVGGVSGRYQTYDVDGRQARLLLAKNPAGWQEALTMIPADCKQVVIAVNGQIPDGEDLSWLWDVDFGRINSVAPEVVVASGERAADLAVRLEYAGIHCETVPDPLAAIESLKPGGVQVLANYTAFRDLKKEIEK